MICIKRTTKLFYIIGTIVAIIMIAVGSATGNATLTFPAALFIGHAIVMFVVYFRLKSKKVLG